jgi:hypothetical protein
MRQTNRGGHSLGLPGVLVLTVESIVAFAVGRHDACSGLDHRRSCLAISIQIVLEVLSTAIKQEKLKGTQVGKKEVK